MKQAFFLKLQDLVLEGERIEAPSPIPWYPDDLGWHFDCSRRAVRSSPQLEAFHKFLVNETEHGNLSRQEAVSMIPPMFLDVEPCHRVLDMCAAPGSKTAQIVEFLHANAPESDIPRTLQICREVPIERTKSCQWEC